MMTAPITASRIRELIQSLPVYEPFAPECFSIPSGRNANETLWEHQAGFKTNRRITFDREKRYTAFFYSDHDEIAEINEYLISYQARHRRVIDMQRQRLVHPFGDVDHFALIYRHCKFLNDWLGIAPKVARHRWRIPDRLMWSGHPIIMDSPDYQSFVRNMQHLCDEGPKSGFDLEFQEDIDELGSTRIVIESDTDFFLESDYSGRDPDWLTKWTLLKLRWT